MLGKKIFMKKRKVKEKINILTISINNLTKMLEEGNLLELTYILGNKKEIIKRNLLAGIFRGIGIRNRSYSNNSDSCYNTPKNCYIKYTDYR